MNLFNNAFAEVFESSLSTITGTSWQWNTVPPFGSFIKIKNDQRTVYAVVYDTKTTSLDPMREIHVYKKTEEEMKKEYPHLFEFLKTTFHALIVGYHEENAWKYTRHTIPIKLYSLIEPVSEKEIADFFFDSRSMTCILHPGIVIDQYDDFLFTIIETQKKLNILTKDRLSILMNQYALKTGASYRQLKAFFDRIVL